METFPTEDDLGLRVTRSSAGQVNINAQARGELGRVVTYAGKKLEQVNEERMERKIRAETGAAELDFAKRTSEINKSFNGRTDFAKFEDDYEAKMLEARGASEALLTNSVSRDAFTKRADLSMIRGRDSINGKAWGLEVDQGRAKLKETLAEARTLTVGSDDADERAGYQTMVEENLNAAMDNGYVSAEQGEAIGREYVRDVTRGVFDAKDTAGQQEMLKNDPMMAYLDEDERVGLQNKVDKNVKADAREAKLRLKEDAWSMVHDGRDPKTFPPDVRATLGRTLNSMSAVYKNMQKNNTPYAEHSDKVMYQRVLALTDGEIVEVDVRALEGVLTEGDFGRVMARRDKAENKLDSQKNDPKLSGTINRAFSNLAPTKMDWGSRDNSDKKRAGENLARDQMADWVEDFVAEKGRKPYESEIRTEVARMMVSVNVDTMMPFDNENTLVFNSASLSDEEKAVATVPYANINNKIKADILAVLGQTEDEVDEGFMEELAGAYALNDRPRIQALLRRNAETN